MSLTLCAIVHQAGHLTIQRDMILKVSLTLNHNAVKLMFVYFQPKYLGNDKKRRHRIDPDVKAQNARNVAASHRCKMMRMYHKYHDVHCNHVCHDSHHRKPPTLDTLLPVASNTRVRFSELSHRELMQLRRLSRSARAPARDAPPQGERLKISPDRMYIFTEKSDVF